MKKTIFAAILGLGLAASGAAFAQTSGAMSSPPSGGAMSSTAGSMSHNTMAGGSMSKTDMSMKPAKQNSTMSSGAMNAMTAGSAK